MTQMMPEPSQQPARAADQPEGQDLSRYALLLMSRKDMHSLNAWEEWAVQDRDRFDHWVRSFANEPVLWRTAPAAEVAALLRQVDESPAWVDVRLVGRLQAGIAEQLGDFDLDLVRHSRAGAVDEVRKAQDPERHQGRLEVLEKVDEIYARMERAGEPIKERVAQLLQERGLVDLDAEAVAPVERIGRTNGSRTPGLQPPTLCVRPDHGRGIGR